MNALHIISFDVPYPANYGGVIDVFYKIRALHREGIKIHLHCFEYHRPPADELRQYCESVSYYSRKTGWKANLCIQPYIVESRQSEKLTGRLLMDDLPILFEGMHTCGTIDDLRFRGRLLVYRESNIEHRYYFHLFKAERNIAKKLYLLAESFKLRGFQRRMKAASVMLAVSETDANYLQEKFPEKRVIHLPSFHGHDIPDILPGKGSYCLFHGNLSVPENYRAVEYIITEIWEDDFPDLVIAGLNPPAWLKALVSGKRNMKLTGNPGEMEMFQLIRHAHLHLMITFQATGLKLKLLNALFNGRFCLVNPAMVSGTGLEALCHLADSPMEFKSKISSLFGKNFDESEITARKSELTTHYSDRNNCKRLMEILNLHQQ